MKKIIIELDGGLVQSVTAPSGLELVIEVRDRDVEGVDLEEISVDEKGEYTSSYPEIDIAD